MVYSWLDLTQNVTEYGVNDCTFDICTLMNKQRMNVQFRDNLCKDAVFLRVEIDRLVFY